MFRWNLNWLVKILFTMFFSFMFLTIRQASWMRLFKVKKLAVQWLASTARVISLSGFSDCGFYGGSTCWNPWLIPDSGWKWWLAYRDAMSFRNGILTTAFSFSGICCSWRNMYTCDLRYFIIAHREEHQPHIFKFRIFSPMKLFERWHLLSQLLQLSQNKFTLTSLFYFWFNIPKLLQGFPLLYQLYVWGQCCCCRFRC
jgi:hypothetical protein